MKRSRRKIPRIKEEELLIDKFFGLNTFGPHADDPPGTFRTFSNFDDYIDYIKERRGSAKFATDICPNHDILSHAVIDIGNTEFGVIQQNNGGTSEFRFTSLDDNFSWETVKLKGTTTPYTLATTVAADMMVSNGKVYIMSTAGNSILEYDSSTGKLVRRKMGLPAPQIYSISSSSGSLSGKRVYAVELVYKDTSVSPEVDLIVSGPNRARTSGDGLLAQGRFAYTDDETDKRFTIAVSSTLNDGTLIDATENNNWTHARLYRSKDLTTATNTTQGLEGETQITGDVGEMFQVQEMTRSAFLFTEVGGSYFFEADNVLDDDMEFPSTVSIISVKSNIMQ